MRVNLDAMSDLNSRVSSIGSTLYECKIIVERVRGLLADNQMADEFDTRLLRLVRIIEDQIVTAEKTASSVDRVCEVYRGSEQRLLYAIEGGDSQKPGFRDRTLISVNADVMWVIK